ncbi:MAG: hypothetical protein WBC02_02190 [Candidatus Aminicenantaceae bacterium]
MKKILISLLIVLVTGVLVGSLTLCKGKPKIKSAVENSYDEVTSKLNQGGNLYLYVSTERVEKFVDEFGGKLRKIIEAEATRYESENTETLKIFDFVFGMIKKCGLTEISGIGMSSVTMKNNYNHSKVVVHHYKEKGKGRIWQLLEEKSHDLDGLKLLPADTVLAGFIDFRLNMLWQWIKKEVEASDIPDLKKNVLSLEPLLEGQGIQLDKLLDSFSGRIGYLLTLDSEKKFTIPIGQTPLEIPEPGLALVFYVKDDTFFNLLETKLPSAQKSEEEGIKKLTIPVPPMPMPLKPEIVQTDDMLILASSPSIIEAMLAAKENGNGLTATQEFKELSKHIPLKGNGFDFIGSRLFHNILDIQKKAMEVSGEIKDEGIAAKELFDMLPKDMAVFAVLQNSDEGLVYSTNHAMDLELLVLMPAIQATGIMAAVAVPNAITAVQKAKQKNSMKDMVVISGSLADYVTDNGITPKQDGIYDRNSEFNKALSPFYVKILPVKDSWGNNFIVYCGKACSGKYGISGAVSDDFVVVSYGRDGKKDNWKFSPSNPEAGLFVVEDIEDFDKDLVAWNGSWIRAPRRSRR